MEYEVYEFTYNGFYGNLNSNKKMNYIATFKKWTNDPGVGVFECSDGKERFIPTFAIVNFKRENHPIQDYGGDKKNKLLFGAACAS